MTNATDTTDTNLTDSLITCTVTDFESDGSAALEAYRGRTLTTEQEINNFIATVQHVIATRGGFCMKTWFTLATVDGEYSVDMREDVTADSPSIREALAQRIRFWNTPRGKEHAQALKLDATAHREMYVALADALEGDYEPQATDANEAFYSQAFGL